MAARRLLLLLVALLLISSLATALAPPQRAGEETTGTTTEEAERDEVAAAGPTGAVVSASFDASRGGRKDPVLASVGDQLSLEVRAGETMRVEIPGLGLYETAASGAPALFDVVLRQEGSFEVLAGGERIGTIRVGGGDAGGEKDSAEREPPRQPEEDGAKDAPGASTVTT